MYISTKLYQTTSHYAATRQDKNALLNHPIYNPNMASCGLNEPLHAHDCIKLKYQHQINTCTRLKLVFTKLAYVSFPLLTPG